MAKKPKANHEDDLFRQAIYHLLDQSETRQEFKLPLATFRFDVRKAVRELQQETKLSRSLSWMGDRPEARESILQQLQHLKRREDLLGLLVLADGTGEAEEVHIRRISEPNPVVNDRRLGRQ